MIRNFRLAEEIQIRKPVTEVFNAWATADQMAKWFAPMAVEAPAVELDFRIGGRYSIRMKLPNDVVFTTTGKFREIVVNERIVMTWRCDAFPDPESLVTVAFEASGNGTVVRVCHEQLSSDDTCANHKHGWMLCLSGLKSLLEQP